MLQCEIPAGLVQLVPGGPEQAAQLAAHRDVAAVSLTGSVPAGRAVSAICAAAGKPLQAELGGNNAMLVLADARLETQVPIWAMISSAAMARVAVAVAAARERGGRVLAGGEQQVDVAGHYFPPTLVTDLSADDPLVQEELFGPVAVLQLADDFEHGMALVNGVSQGLLAAIATTSPALQAAFAAPFGGFKDSQRGPPEHGVWDREFFSRVQVRYTGAE